MYPKINRVKERLSRGEIALGGVAQMSSPEAVEIIGAAGYDFVWIDMEHGAFYFETAVAMIRAADAMEMTPVVRVPDHTPSFIMRMLDAGVMGIMVPGVSTREHAEAVVRAARYNPLGYRGACPMIRAAGHQSENWGQFVKWSNENVMVWLLVEGKEGVDNFESIIQVPGIDAIVMGPFDLSQSLGHPGEITHPEVVSRIEGMFQKTRAKGIDMVTVVFSTEPDQMLIEAKRWVGLGSRIVAAPADKNFLTASFNSAAKNLRAIFKEISPH